MSDRLPVETFDIPFDRIRAGHHSAVYFNRAEKVVEAHKPDLPVTMQVFQKNYATLCGIDEAIAILRTCSGKQTGDQGWTNQWSDLEVRALNDGDAIEPWEPVMTIRGPLSAFVHLESVYLGVLARGTKVASNTSACVEAAKGKPVLFFADRFDRYTNQAADGYAATCGGARGLAVDAMGDWTLEQATGTMPHALIAAYHGNTVAACTDFANMFPEVSLTALVDFDNDCVITALDCLEKFGEDLYAVRLDTSESLVDYSLNGGGGDYKPTGVNTELVKAVRKGLDLNDGKHVKIIVSGGFNPTKIAEFEKKGAAVDVYAVGSSMLQGSFDFTADCVEPVAKTGRWLRDESRLELVT